MQIPTNHKTLFILHVDFSLMKISLGFQASTFYCKVNLDGWYLFVQLEHLDCYGHGPSILCVKWPYI